MTPPEPITQVPPWLRAKVDQHVAHLELNVGGDLSIFADYGIVLMTLTEPDSGDPRSLAIWERRCDNCLKYTPPGLPFYTGVLEQPMLPTCTLSITFGVCHTCSSNFKDGELRVLT